MRLTRYNAPLWRPYFAAVGNGEAPWQPATDVQATDSDYVIRLDVPGVHEKNIDIEVRNGALRVSGEREAATQNDFSLRERRTGRFQRVFQLSGRVDADRITASYRLGVLEIRVPKADNRRQIPIQ